jgi:EAL and modified HD-GYP domain-containing signal transduction protein
LPKDRVVLEILETVGLTDDIIARCKYLSEAGFRLALDDIVGLDDRQRAVLPHIAIIKVDRQHLSNEDLAGLVQKYAPYSLTLLAEKVETQDQYQYCRSLGFSLFQGYFFAKPTIITGRSLQPSTTMLLKLFCLTARDTELDDLEDAVKQVPEVALALLRTANSVAFGVTGKVTSVRRAIFLVGRIQLNRMVQILMFAMNSNTTATANPLLQCAAVRGRLMEGLAVTTGRPDLKDRAFIAGMLSLIDVLFQQPMSEIIEQLNLDELTQDALLNRRGELGALLRLVEAIEQSDQEPVLRVIEKLVMTDAAKLNQLHVDALRWANTL